MTESGDFNHMAVLALPAWMMYAVLQCNSVLVGALRCQVRTSSLVTSTHENNQYLLPIGESLRSDFASTLVECPASLEVGLFGDTPALLRGAAWIVSGSSSRLRNLNVSDGYR